MPRLNKNILAFDCAQSASELLKEIRSTKPNYVVLRLTQAPPAAAEFFVFPTSYLAGTLLGGVSILKRRATLLSLLPQLTSDSAAPQLTADHLIDSWNNLYEDGPWPSAFYPVSTAYGHALGVWESNGADVLGTNTASIIEDADADSEDSVEEQTIEEVLFDDIETETDIEKEADTAEVDGFDDLLFPLPASPPSRNRISDFKETIGGLFSSDKKSSSRPTPIDLSLLEETFPDEAFTEHETEVAIDEIDSLLQNHTLFPNIEASNLHPIIEEPVHITVSLQAEQVREVTGLVSFPDVGDEDYVYDIKVHLLCGEESHWDVLQYSQGEGMLKDAEFQLTMPDMPLELSGNYPERHKLPVRVNFYFRNRWCGEGERYLDLRLDGQVEALRRIPPPPQSEWRKLIKLEPMSEPPDLLVRIAHKPGTTSYHWSCLSPHLEFDQTADAVMTLSAGAQEFVSNLFEPFATIQLNTHQSTTLKGICEEIYDSTPEVFKQAFWQLSNAAEISPFEFKSILFISDEPYIPWELMRVTDPQLQEDAGILSTTHSVGRWLANSSNYLTQHLSINRFVACGSDYFDQRTIPNLPWVGKELDQLTERYHAEQLPLTSTDVLSFLQNGSAQAMHFACHGTMSVKTPYKSQLLMEDHPQSITPPNISSYEVETGLGAQHPLIFLNACQSGSTANSLSLVSGFPAAFLKAGASAVICPLWTVDDEQANVISQIFYEAAFEQPGITLGEIMQKIHQRWESEQQLTYLAYVLYGDPQTRVEFLPEIHQ